MIHVQSFTYEQFRNDIFEDFEDVFVDNIENDILKTVSIHFSKSTIEMIRFLKEGLKPNLDEVEVLQIKTSEKNLFLFKKNRKI
jgi:hypothetical protein